MPLVRELQVETEPVLLFRLQIDNAGTVGLDKIPGDYWRRSIHGY
jgi:hypothetical protein